ncbi:MAG: pentapeptide repeat-containing protein [Actinobacteria bacterium]|nr:pentapeptide repeat-containing protein [Actinomycetota bacterium]
MARPRSAPAFAQVDPIVLPPLTEGDVDEGIHHEARSFQDVDLGGLPFTGGSFVECELTGVSAHETQFRDASFVETAVRRLNAPVLLAARSTLRDISIEASRLGSIDMHETSWSSVLVRGCKLGFVNLRAATLANVIFEDCTIEELDLSGAQVNRLTFVRTAVDSLVATRTQFIATDLRGAAVRRFTDLASLKGTTMSPDQATELGQLFAVHLGIALL